MDRTYVKIDDIIISNGRRPVNARKVKALAAAIKKQGLLHPIVIYRLNGTGKGKFGLSAGAHRLAACKMLNLTTILAIIVDRPQAKIIASSENLHRNELSILQRSEEIAKYADATNFIKNKSEKRGGPQPHDKRISELARRTGFSRKIVSQAFLHARMSFKVRSLLTDRGLSNKRSVLDHVAKLEGDQRQVAHIDKVAPPPRKGMAMRKKPLKSAREVRKVRRTASSPLKLLTGLWRTSGMERLFAQQSRGIKKKFIRRIQ